MEILCTADGNVKLIQVWNTRKSMVAPRKLKNKTTLLSSNVISGYISKRSEISILEWYLHFQIHCSITHSSQDYGNNPNVYKQIRKEDEIYLCNGLLFSLKEKNCKMQQHG